ncbi:PH domain-containing protein [Candidatus Gracilibacteria bacterium]|nr:PH domain-containing protein [Candidatus Gracilibacteria bacterium]
MTEPIVAATEQTPAPIAPRVMRKSVAALLVRAVLTAVIVGIICYIIANILTLAGLYPSDVFLVTGVFFMTVFGIYLITCFLQWYSNYYLLNQDTVTYVVGIFAHKEKGFALKNMSTVSVKQSLIGQLLQYGTIRMTFSTPTTNESEMYMADISDPNTIKALIESIAIKN